MTDSKYIYNFEKVEKSKEELSIIESWLNMFPINFDTHPVRFSTKLDKVR